MSNFKEDWERVLRVELITFVKSNPDQVRTQHAIIRASDIRGLTMEPNRFGFSSPNPFTGGECPEVDVNIVMVERDTGSGLNTLNAGIYKTEGEAVEVMHKIFDWLRNGYGDYICQSSDSFIADALRAEAAIVKKGAEAAAGYGTH